MTTGGMCPRGHYCPPGSPNPVPCDGGQYCDKVGLSQPTGNCSAGFYCNGTSDVPDQHECPEGHYCPVGSPLPVACPPGTYINSTHNDDETDCVNCTGGMYCMGSGNVKPDAPCLQGYYCPGGQAADSAPELLCWIGHYCEEGTVLPVACPNGTFQPNSGNSDCVLCSPGYYCDSNNANVTYVGGTPVVNPTVCPVGHYCPSGSILPTPCPAGTYGPSTLFQTEQDCPNCTAGMSCETDGLEAPTTTCHGGHYCTSGAFSRTPRNHNVDPGSLVFTGNDVCPTGYFCPNGTGYPLPCPTGTYSEVEELAAEAECQPCLGGRYCNVTAYTTPNDAPLCSPGYVCSSGSNTPTPSAPMGYICPPGFYCPEGSAVETGCDIGYFNPDFGKDACTICPAGYMCDTTNMTTPSDCKRGHYCPTGVPPRPCPPGTFNNQTGLDNEQQCTDCTVGQYCQGWGNEVPTGPCQEGFWCEGGAASRVPNITNDYPNNGPCPVGHYCPEGTPTPIQCPAGTLRNVTGGAALEDCLPCTGGSYCETSGLSQPTGLCQRGYYCPSNHSTTTKTPTELPCTPGHYCPEGSSEPLGCPGGESQPNQGQWECIKCPAGYYCVDSLTPDPKDCPPYKYCPEGTKDPLLCPNGTYTLNDTTNLQGPDECLPCPAGVYCRGGEIQGPCAAGYWCAAGSEDYTPSGAPPPNPCPSNQVCAGPCPPGFWCYINTVTPTPCPEHTLRDTMGGNQLSDCGPCPAGSWCHEGDPVPQPCPPGHYCLTSVGPTECPRLTYRDTEGAANISECHACPAGFWCNQTGMTNYTNHLCPVGMYCDEGQEPSLCPAGRMRPNQGAGSWVECEPCRDGFYCPNDTINTQGIPCPATFMCPHYYDVNSIEWGASAPIECPGGYFCPNKTGDPLLCPGGYYCPNATDVPYLCNFSYYCPNGTETPQKCPLGNRALDHPGLRWMYQESCELCPGGTYGNHSERLVCNQCPGGYYCPEGTGNGDSYTCPNGSYCPPGSSQPSPCPLGYYGNRERAEVFTDCAECPENTFNNLLGQVACRPCGSSSTSIPGQAKCTCTGNYRTFQTSDGVCQCMSGYIYYDETDTSIAEGNGDQDCQPIVDTRCSYHQARDVATRECIYPEQRDCFAKCGDNGGVFATETGSCVCNTYVDPDALCDSNCIQQAPNIYFKLNSDGSKSTIVVDPVSGNVTETKCAGVYGPLEHAEGAKTIHVVSHWEDRLTSSIYTEPLQPETLCSEPLNEMVTGVFVNGSVATRRRLLQAAVTNPVATDGVPEIPNPLICVQLDEMVMFRIWVNTSDRAYSHYPVYVKDHLYNTNADFDFGPFTRLAYFITQTNVSYSAFAHLFEEAGNYVFKDSMVPDREVIITVKGVGNSCPTGVSRVQSSSPTNLATLGIAKGTAKNEEPDWGLIIGLLAFLAACILMLVVAVIVWRPRDAGIYPMKHWKPKYRSLGAPPPVPHYMLYDVDHWPGHEDPNHMHGPEARIAGDGAEAGLLAAPGSGMIWKDNGELENFNVRVLYDKLEDQNLYMAAQLARQQDDLRGFYERISNQNEDLKRMLNNLDLHKLEEAERQRQQEGGVERENIQTASAQGPTIVNANVTMGGPGTGEQKEYKFMSGMNDREKELMLALQMMLDKLASGNIPITAEMIEHARQTGGATSTSSGGPQRVKGQSELLRKHNAEKLKLERELEDEESRALDSLLIEHDTKRQEELEELGRKLAFELQGVSDADAADIIQAHEEEVERLLKTLDGQRDLQAEALRQKLAARRRQKESKLHEKHISETNQAGLPPPTQAIDVTDDRLRREELKLHTLHTEENTGLSNAEAEVNDQYAEEKHKRMTDTLKEHIEALVQDGILSEEEKNELIRLEMERAAKLRNQMTKRREQQLAKVRQRMQNRRSRRNDEMKHEHEKAKRELSTKLIQEGKHEELEQRLAEMDRLHQAEREALNAEIDEEEQEEIKHIVQSNNKEHTDALKETHKQLLAELPNQHSGVDAVLQQKLLEMYRKDVDNLNSELESQKDRQLNDMKAKLAARKARKLKEIQRLQEEEAAKRFVSEQEKQMKQVVAAKASEDDMLRLPEVHIGESIEEQALRKEQERAREEMRERHEHEREDLGTKLEQSARQGEQDTLRNLENEKEKILREKKNKQAAELAARTDLSEEEMAALIAQHEHDLEELADKLDSEKRRQQAALRDRLADRKARKMAELRRKQEGQLTKEMIEQKKELDEVKTEKSKEAEQKAMVEGVQENGIEDSDKVVKACLAARHARELSDLDTQFAGEKKLMVDDALGKLEEQQERVREDMQNRHERELADLMQEDLSPDELQQKRAELLNRQQLEMSQLDKKHANEQKEIKKGALAEWEVRYARAKLDMKERHYKEFADALREFDPNHASAKQADMAIEELEEVKKKLDAQAKEQQEKLKKEREAFEAEEKKRLANELMGFEKQLEAETEREKERHQRNIEALNKRKEEMMAEKKQKTKEEMERLQSQGASQEEQDRLLEEHQRDMQNLMNKMDADKLRAQSNLQEKLKKRREEKFKAKQAKLVNQSAENKKEFEEKQKSEADRLKADEALTLKESVNIDKMLTKDGDDISLSGDVMTNLPAAGTSQGALPASFTMAAPMNDSELTALLMQSPLYQKLEQIKKAASGGGVRSGHKMAPGEGYIDEKDAAWSGDSELNPVDLNKLSARSFVVYKFGCFITDLVAQHCQHLPVTLLLADKIPANKNLAHNAYRNSFHYDANNRIVYIRSARLDNVGEFTLILVHALAHIKAGDLRDDSNPEFAREFYRALSVVCDDLFFARYRRSSPITKTLAGTEDNASLERASNTLLNALFGECDNETEKNKMVDDLLDVKLQDGTNKDGVCFNADRMKERMTKYTKYGVSSKLREQLGDVENKMAAAKANGSQQHVDSTLDQHGVTALTTGNSLLTRKLTDSTMANMTGTALWQTFLNKSDTSSTKQSKKHKDRDIHKQHLKNQVADLMEQIDALNADFSQQAKQHGELEESIQSLEQEVAAQTDIVNKSKTADKRHTDSVMLLKDTTVKLSSARQRLVTIHTKKAATSEKLEKVQLELDAKKSEVGEN
ncbi:unnamed protein product [Owenia fusiformis]|uniref:Uncharacterized protein n=1 Tax=Owenia fusiformis TaxID=6347 RepID=A0A8S4PSM3_OWEFU|nr:unnamed protein product [Owenia fusiformis]